LVIQERLPTSPRESFGNEKDTLLVFQNEIFNILWQERKRAFEVDYAVKIKMKRNSEPRANALGSLWQFVVLQLHVHATRA
jgi:hypothetical protein